MLHLTGKSLRKQKLSQLPFHRRLGSIFKKGKNLLRKYTHTSDNWETQERHIPTGDK